MNQQKQGAWFRAVGGAWGVRLVATWQGWLVVAIYIGLGIVGFLTDMPNLYFLALIIRLLVIYQLKSARQARSSAWWPLSTHGVGDLPDAHLA